MLTDKAQVLELSAEMPDEGVLERWRGEPLKAVIVPTSIFLTNRKGFPTLSKRHQSFLLQLFSVCIPPSFFVPNKK